MPKQTDPSRNLLFGLLALQTGLIDQGALFAAFAAWTRDVSRSLADHLVALGKLDAPRRAAVEAIAGVHVQALGGDVEKSLAVLAVGRSTRESLARAGGPDVEATLGHVGSAHSPTYDGDDPDRTGSISVGSATSDGQRFRILRPHARGGLGAVFAALDSELDREVALKQILDDRADDPTSRFRFLIEARITGGLEHPGIVPVYGLGSYGDGRPYYAMRFIRGDSLKETIDQFHTGSRSAPDSAGSRDLALRKLLRRFTDVCNAIDYAHSRGVIHRDIKPANIIVGKHGETLVVDWGLAKPMGRALPGTESGERLLMPLAANGSAETLPGSTLGTPAYMSPEQAEGQLERLGPRSDVYSLGATLYCLLTGKPPFEGEVVDVIRAVQKGDFRPPRQLDPNIDPALEAICLKTMAHKPEDRYASSRALADDLDRWMADEPVTAWREPFSRWARRWARRNRTAATAAAVALVAGVVGLSAVLAVQTRANSVLTAKNAELDKANRLKDEANAGLRDANERVTKANADLESANEREKRRFDLAMEAIKLFHGEVGDDLVLKADQFKPLRDKLLKGAADFYSKLESLLKGQTDRASRAAIGNAYFELGNLTTKIGNVPEAVAVHRKALAVRRSLAARPEADAGAKLELARSLIAIGWLLAETGDTGAASMSLGEAQRLAEGLSGAVGALSADEVLAKCFSAKGSLLWKTGKPGEALESHRRALAVCQRLADANRDHNSAQNELAKSHHDLGALLSQVGEPARALESYERARVIWQRLVDGSPHVPAFGIELSKCLTNIGWLKTQTGALGEAMQPLEQAIAIVEKLARDNPAVTAFKRNLADVHNGIAIVSMKTAKPDLALAAYERSLSIRQKLADENPDVPDFLNDVAASHFNIGILHSDNSRPTEALESYRRALVLRQKLADAHPAIPLYQFRLTKSLTNLGALLAETGKPIEALQAYRQAEKIDEKLVEANPRITDFRMELAISKQNIGLVLGQSGDIAGSLESHRQAMVLLSNLTEKNPSVAPYRFELAKSHDSVGALLAVTGKKAEALEESQTALAIQQKLADEIPNVPDYQEQLTVFQGNVADILWTIGQPAKARAMYERAVTVHEALVKADPTSHYKHWALARSLFRLGQMRMKDGMPATAAADWKRAVRIYEGVATLSSEKTYEWALCQASLSAAAGRPGSGIPAAEASIRADLAMGLLSRAVSAGYRNLDSMRTEAGLDPLRSRLDFRLLLMDVAFPANPFAR